MTGKKQLFAIGIVTHNRPGRLMRLLRCLSHQAPHAVAVFINENGSNNVTRALLGQFARLHSILLKQREASVPKARNAIIQRAKNKYQWLVFIDDDCLPSKKWLATINNFLTNSTANNFWTIQGVSRSIPFDCLYANVSGMLYKLWFDANTVGSSSALLDTKCCALNMTRMDASGLLFDETIRYASDIDLGCRINRFNKKNKIHILRQWSVFHEERQSLVQFVGHRTRLSMAFHLIKNKYVGDLVSVDLNTKLRFLWSLKMSLKDKAKIFVAIAVTSILMAVGLRVEQSKFFYRTVASKRRPA